MNKSLLFSLALLPISAIANPMAPMIDMSINMMKQSGELARGANCLGISESKFEKGTRNAMESCFAKHNMEQDDLLNQCMEQQFVANLGVSKSKMDRCKPSDEPDPMEAYDNQMDALMDQFGENGPTEAQMRQLEELQRKQMQESMAMMEQMGNAMESASQGTESDITLPIYKNSKIKMHLTSGMNQFAGNNDVLPAATFASPDDINTIVKFYKAKLPNFKYKKLSGGDYIFMEKMPANFDILTHMSAYTSTPHVLISEAPDNQRMIEIAYRK